MMKRSVVMFFILGVLFSGCSVDLGFDYDDKAKIKSVVYDVQHSLKGIHLELQDLNKKLEHLILMHDPKA